MTEIEVSLPGRFSFPPIRDGRAALPWALPVVDVNSGVSEFLRLVVEVLGRFWPATAFGTVVALGAAEVDF